MSTWDQRISAALVRIREQVVETPVHETDVLWDGPPVLTKLEQLQHTGSFKARGAFNNLLTREVPKAGIVAASGGNHGAAAGFAARTLGHPARIYVPEIAGPSKIALIQGTGADLQVVPGTYAEALQAALDYEADTGAIQLHAYDAPETVAGQGTVFAEWEAQGLDADTVLIAVGGGGLIAGALAWFRGRRRIVAVEPTACPTLAKAIEAGAPVETDVGGVAANALGARKIGQICYDLARDAPLRSVLVSDADIEAAQRRLWQRARLLVEPAGATALAALTSGAYLPEPGERVAVLICGANPAPDPLVP